MTDRPILFSAPMVRALLDGRKSQTRRVLKDVPIFSPDYDEQWRQQLLSPGGGLPDYWSWWSTPAHSPSTYHFQHVLYASGDRLWVREAWRCNGWATDVATIFYQASEGDGYTAMCEQYPVAGKRALRVDGKWRPSIHMPRWVSRLTLIVTDVRVQRLQDISEADAEAEGIGSPEIAHFGCSIKAFAALWNSLSRTDEAAWDANPWVVAVSFETHRCNIDAMERLAA